MSSRTANRLYRRNRAIVLSRNSVCFICGRQIDMELKFPDPMSASVDHVIPHSKGGTDAVDNLKACHLDCNRRKYSKDFNQLDIRKTGGIDW